MNLVLRCPLETRPCMWLLVQEVTYVKLADMTCHTLTHSLNSYDSWKLHTNTRTYTHAYTCTHILRATLIPECSTLALHTNNTALYHCSEWLHKTGNHGSHHYIIIYYEGYPKTCSHCVCQVWLSTGQQHCVKMVIALSDIMLSHRKSGTLWHDFILFF